MFTGNHEPNFNKLDIFIDVQPGGENTLSPTPDYEFFDPGGCGGGGCWISTNLNGLTFDAGFTADYHLFARWGGGGTPGPYEVDFIDRQGGGAAMIPGSAGVGSATVGLVSTGTVAAGSVGPNASGTALSQPLDFAINNNNAAGVMGGTGPADQVAAAAVTTGMEFSIALADIGDPAPGSALLVSAMINSGDHNFLSNQILGGLPAPQGNLGGDGAGGFTGDLSGVDFGNFGGFQHFIVVVPVPPLDHFTVYDATGADGPTVTIDDQFGTQVTDLGLTKLFLVPADKNEEGIRDRFSHLTCYEILDGQPGPPNVTVTNQFVTDAPIDVRLPTELCVPTEKLITPGRVGIDHYKCYDAVGDAVDINVGIVDQFQEGLPTLVADPFRLCIPAEKNGEVIANPIDHLVCYLLQPPGGFLGTAIPIQNQFFRAQDSIDVGTAFGLCVPSLKTVPEPSFILGLGSGLLLLAALDRRRRQQAARDAAAD
jgi:hypothetical protein